MELLVKTFEGFESILAEELEQLGLSDIKMRRRGVSCKGNWAQLYRCNYVLGTALRVLVNINSFELNNQDDLYNAVYSIAWTRYIPDKKSIAVNATVSGELFTHSQYVTYRTKDAIVDQLTEKYGKRPKVDREKPDVLIDIFIRGNQLIVSLDSSGRSLHLRNYKYRLYRAPLNEVLASGILRMSGWKGESTFHDPMSGSGTFTTEALLIAGNIPTGYFNPNFAFQNWKEYNSELWEAVKAAADAGIRHPECKLFASDINGLAVRDTKKNLQKFPFREKVRVFQQDFFRLQGHPGTTLFINPPYNKRIEIETPEAFYQKIGDALKQNWKGSEAWIISANEEAMKHFGLRADTRMPVDHGGTPAKLFNFKIYEGSKKRKYN